MIAVLSKILGSKIFSCILILAVLILVPVVIVTQIQKSSLDYEVTKLIEDNNSKDKAILDLNDQVKLKNLEIQYLQKGMVIANEYDAEKEKVLEDETAVKEQILQTVLSNEEDKDWWNTPIPNDILEYFTCK